MRSPIYRIRPKQRLSKILDRIELSGELRSAQVVQQAIAIHPNLLFLRIL
jgi:hypothetical protein